MTESQNNAYNHFLKRGFIPFDKNTCSVLRQYDSSDNRVWELTATVCANWGPQYNAIYKNIKGFNCSVWFYQEDRIYFFILRPANKESSLQQLVDELFTLSEGAGLLMLQIACIDERFLNEYKDLKGYEIKSEFSDNDSEYIYKNIDMLSLSGGVNELKRRTVNKCSKMSGIEFKPMTNENRSDCFIVEDVWCKNQDCDYCISFAGCPKESLKIMLDNFDPNHHNGLLAYMDGNPIGYAIWEVLNRIGYIHYVKSSIKNFNLYLYYIMTKDYLKDCDCSNLGHDMGMEGLRRFKKHLSAYTLQRKYICTFTKK